MSEYVKNSNGETGWKMVSFGPGAEKRDDGVSLTVDRMDKGWDGKPA